MAKKRKRVSRDKIRENAEKGSRGGSDWFVLPEGVGRWSPEKAARYNIDMVPYEVKTDSHPDDVEKDCLWYKFPFNVHHGIGVNGDSVVCPTSVGKRCPICEKREQLRKEDSEEYAEVIKALRFQKFVAYNILDPENEGQIAILVLSRGKLATCLEDELKDPENEGNLLFFDTNEDGRTLRVRFSHDSFEGRKFLLATKIDFKPRDEMDEDEILDATVCLEEALIVIPYDKLKAMFLQEETPEEEETPEPADDEEPEEETPEGDEDDDSEEGDDSEEEESPDDEEDGEDDDSEEEETPPEITKTSRVYSEEHGPDFPGNVFSILKSGKIKVRFDDGDEGTYPPEELTYIGEQETVASKKKTTAKKDSPKENKKKDDTPECPAEGGTFGEVDQHDECDDCPHWNECEAVSA